MENFTGYALLIYLYFTVSNILVFATVITLLALIISTTVAGYKNDTKCNTTYYKEFKSLHGFRILYTFIIVSTINIAIPTERTISYMLGGATVISIAKDTDIPPKVLKAAEAFLDKIAEERTDD